jgi:hypothetical protein
MGVFDAPLVLVDHPAVDDAVAVPVDLGPQALEQEDEQGVRPLLGPHPGDVLQPLDALLAGAPERFDVGRIGPHPQVVRLPVDADDLGRVGDVPAMGEGRQEPPLGQGQSLVLGLT